MLDVQWHREAPLHDELVDGRLLSRLDHLRGDAVAPCIGDDLGIERVEQHAALRLDQLGVVLLYDLSDLVSVIEHDPEVADSPHARVHARRCLAALEPRVAEDALLALAGRPVEVGLLVGTRRDAEPPGTTTLLVEQHHAVFAALVERARRTRGDARRVQAVVADSRQVEEDDLVDVEDLLALLRGQRLQVRVIARVDRRASEVVIPVRPGLDLHRLAGDHRDRLRGRLVGPLGRVEQVLVRIRERLVIVVDRWQVRVVEDGRCPADLADRPDLHTVLGPLEPALVLGLVLPRCRVARAGLGLDVVPPHVLSAAAVGPYVLAGHAACVTADALVEVEDHADLRANVHV